MHPRARKIIGLHDLTKPSEGNLRFIDPVGYLDMIGLKTNAFAIFTDSGGVQKEAFFSRVPYITLRSETEWVETVDSGWNILVGIEKKYYQSLQDDFKYQENTHRFDFWRRSCDG